MRASSMRARAPLLALVCLLAAAALAAAAAASSANSNSSSASASAPSSGAHSSSPISQSKATQARQSPVSAASTIVGALGALVPSLISQVAPFVLLFGLGALMMPQLGQSAMGLLRESRRSAQDPHQQLGLGAPAAGAHFAGSMGQFGALPRPLQTTPQDIYYFTKRSLGSAPSGAASWLPNSDQVLHGLQELLERVARALDNAEKRYNN